MMGEQNRRLEAHHRHIEKNAQFGGTAMISPEITKLSKTNAQNKAKLCVLGVGA